MNYVPENAEMGTHKYIIYETIDISNQMDIFALNNAFFKRYVFVLASNREVGCFFY